MPRDERIIRCILFLIYSLNSFCCEFSIDMKLIRLEVKLQTQLRQFIDDYEALSKQRMKHISISLINHECELRWSDERLRHLIYSIESWRVARSTGECLCQLAKSTNFKNDGKPTPNEQVVISDWNEFCFPHFFLYGKLSMQRGGFRGAALLLRRFSKKRK